MPEIDDNDVQNAVYIPNVTPQITMFEHTISVLRDNGAQMGLQTLNIF